MSERNARRFEVEVAGRTLSFEVGELAEQADGAVLVRYGDTVVLTTATMSETIREGIDFLPLLVDYEEKLYAAGRIPGSFFRREGRPSENAVLAARLTDRPIRPLFPKTMRNDVQVITTVLATDGENQPELLSILGASAALHISRIPWAGPIAAVRVGMIDGEFILNPTSQEIEEGDLNLTVAGTRETVLMVEARAREIPEETMVQAVEFAHRAMQPILDLLEQMRAEVGVEKVELEPPPEPPAELRERVEAFLADRLEAALFHPDKVERQRQTEALREALLQEVAVDPETGLPDLEAMTFATQLFDEIVKKTVRRKILEEGVRPDGRRPEEIRPLHIRVGVLPRVHGSGLFQRGQTQVLTVATLGTPREEQILDDLGIAESKRYIHHYNFPPYCTGEVRPLRAPKRREIGHGALAERALIPVLPPEEEFPYTIRLVSEVLSSNGSSSMASVCGSTLALMDAGVPIRRPVAGIAMGLITGEDGRYRILTDIQGVEDALGDMDFKVAGTAEGITALQLDIKIAGITPQLMREAFEQARQARLFILEKMAEVIPEPRKELAPTAPRIVKVMIDPEKIGALIGPGGKTIRKIIEETGAQIEVEDDGGVYIAAKDALAAKKAIQWIDRLTRDPEVGEIYQGRVVKIVDFGAFVNILPGKDGLVHISELDTGRVARVEDVVKVGDEITVMVTNVDPVTGKISLSRKAVLTGKLPEPRERRGGRGGRDRGRRRNRR